jgi:voltage-gated potassium channel Kch
MRQGFRSSIIPAVNLAQISELSLVIVAIGYSFGHVSAQTQGIIAYAFVFVAILSSYAITVSQQLVGWATPILLKLGVRDQGGETLFDVKPAAHPRIFFLGFFWTASSLLEEITRHAPQLLGELLVIDFNPNVNKELRHRRVPVVYGDITQRDTLLHAGIAKAEVIVCSLPNSILRGASNLKLLQQLRELNREAKIIMHAELFSDVPKLYAAGADYVSVPRLIEARELRKVIEAALAGLIAQRREELDAELEKRKEVIP